MLIICDISNTTVHHIVIERIWMERVVTCIGYTCIYIGYFQIVQVKARFIYQWKNSKWKQESHIQDATNTKIPTVIMQLTHIHTYTTTHKYTCTNFITHIQVTDIKNPRKRHELNRKVRVARRMPPLNGQWKIIAKVHCPEPAKSDVVPNMHAGNVDPYETLSYLWLTISQR